MKRSIPSTSFSLNLTTLLFRTVLLFGVISPIGWFGLIQPLILYVQSDPVYSTSIPWLQNEAACLETGRSWDGDACWDAEHDPNF